MRKGKLVTTDTVPRLDDLPREGLLQEIRRLRAQLQEAQRRAAVGAAAAMVIHEFNNIFTPMQNYARLAAEGSESAADKTISLAREGAPRAAAICQSLLDLAGPDLGGEETVAVGELVGETLSAMGRDLRKDRIRLVLDVPAALAVRTRPVELKQVLLNLLLNAREAVLAKGPGGSIEVRALRRGGRVLIRVGDTGVGMSPEVRRRIFEPFFTTRPGGGTGLGLAVCRQIAEGLGGTLTVRSQPGRGSWFTLALPADAPARRPAERPGKLAVRSA